MKTVNLMTWVAIALIARPAGLLSWNRRAAEAEREQAFRDELKKQQEAT